MRIRDTGLTVGRFPTGTRNSIADVEGVTAGHSTVVEGHGPLVIGKGPARTGVTVLRPHAGDTWTEPVAAGWATLNGTGEWTGLHFIEETGLLYGNVYLTNSHSVGTVRDAVIARESKERGDSFMVLPVVGETFDGDLNDIAGHHVTAAHVAEATDSASTAIGEGSVGGGTGMICHGFKGGIGTSSRVITSAGSEYTVGVLVQANHGVRDEFLVCGVPVGRILSDDVVPVPRVPASSSPVVDKNSILIVVATDAPMTPQQCRRLARRATLGIALNGGSGHAGSGDFALAFSTDSFPKDVRTGIGSVEFVDDETLNLAFDSVIECTQEAILNALMAATTTVGRDDVTAHALDHELLVQAVRQYDPFQPSGRAE